MQVLFGARSTSRRPQVRVIEKSGIQTIGMLAIARVANTISDFADFLAVKYLGRPLAPACCLPIPRWSRA